MKLVNFKMPEQMHDRLRAYSKTDGLSVSEHVRRAIDRYLKEFEIQSEAKGVGTKTSKQHGSLR